MRHWIDGVSSSEFTAVYPVFAALNRGDGHEPSGVVSNPDLLAPRSIVDDGEGVSLSGHDDEHPAILVTTPAPTVLRNTLRIMEGINNVFRQPAQKLRSVCQIGQQWFDRSNLPVCP